MEYSVLADTYDRIEATRKRLEMADHLVGLFRATDMELIDKVVYLTQGRLYPQFVGIELGLAEKLVIKALSFVTGLPKKEVTSRWMKEGDLGKVAEDIIEGKRQTTLFSSALTVERVYNNFESIAKASGSGAQDLKIKLLGDLLHDSGRSEAKYITRSVIGKLRLGIADMTLVDSLARTFIETPEDIDEEGKGEEEEAKERLKAFRKRVEHTYNISSDLGAIAKALAKEGPGGLDRFRLTVGVPIRVMLAERMSSFTDIFDKFQGPASLEFKYDGLRIQAHIGPDGITLFSRQLENVTEQFPDVVEDLRKAVRAKEVIVEGECVTINIETGEMRPFQEVSHRRGRKYGLKGAIEEYPVAMFLFDCLYVDGEDLLSIDYSTRRKRLASAIDRTERVIMSEALTTDQDDRAEAFFNKAIESGCEGVMAKQPSSPYKAGARGWQWIKYKRDYKADMTDTVDLVIIGAFTGHGKRKGLYGALLMACYDHDEDRFETVCKLGTGFSDEFLVELKERLAGALIDGPHPRVDTDLKADFHFRPEYVLEVAGAEVTLSPVHTCAKDMVRKGAGLAIRFPRYTGRWRDDKAPEDATSTDEMVSFYEAQVKRS